MSNTAIILQIMFITIGMIILGMILNRILGLRREIMKEFRDKAFNLQERLRNAQVLGDMQLMMQLQRETVQLTKQIMVKQFVPMCIRCLIFIGIFMILGFIYSNYDSGLLSFPLLFFGSGWVAIYIVFSLSFSLAIFGVKLIYKKLTGQETRKQNYLRDIMQILSPSQESSGFSLGLSTPVTSKTGIQQSNVHSSDIEESSTKNDSWKHRIQK